MPADRFARYEAIDCRLFLLPGGEKKHTATLPAGVIGCDGRHVDDIAVLGTH